MALRLTDRLVRSLPAPLAGNKITYCDELKGFGCRVTYSGAKSFVLNYRAGGRERRITVGSYPEWSVAAAREQVAKLKRDIDLGSDPLDQRNSDRDAPTVQDLFVRYSEEHLPRKATRSAADDASMWKNYILPKLGRVRLKDLTASDVDTLHRTISKLRPTRANRVVEVLRKGLNLATRWGWVPKNPALGVQRNPEQPRQRYLSQSEIAYISAALDTSREQASANAIRLLMFTGARRTEVLSAEWSQFDLQNAVWTKPSHHTKQRREHRIPLSVAAQQLLTRLHSARTSQRYVFPSNTALGHVQDIKKSWDTIKKSATVIFWHDDALTRSMIGDLEAVTGGPANFQEIFKTAATRGINLPAGLLDVRIHDLRHTYASILAGQGTSLALIGALLGHTQTQTTHRYAHLADDPLRKATEAVAKAISSANGDNISPPSTDNR